MFVYHVESGAKPEPEKGILQAQFLLMQKRVYKIICNFAAVLTWSCGIAMICLYGMDWFVANTWLHVKLVLLAILTGYHIYCKVIIGKLERNEEVMSAFGFRLFNEVPSLLLLAIVLLASLRSMEEFVGTLPYILAFGVAIFFLAKMYKRIREK